MTELSRFIKDLFPKIGVDYDELDEVDVECPRCGEGVLYQSSGKLITVRYCKECRFEGAKVP